MIKGDGELQAPGTEPGLCSRSVSFLHASPPLFVHQLQYPQLYYHCHSCCSDGDYLTCSWSLLCTEPSAFQAPIFNPHHNPTEQHCIICLIWKPKKKKKTDVQSSHEELRLPLWSADSTVPISATRVHCLQTRLASKTCPLPLHSHALVLIRPEPPCN